MGDIREFHFNQNHFNELKKLVYDYAGISLSDAKEQLVYGRLARRLRALGLKSFDDYCDLLRNDPGDEFTHFINAITTNLTAFFRENHHFESLQKSILPKLMQYRQSSKKLRIWSAGCSTGEEPYSIAITMLESVPEDWDVKILATDIDSNVVATASAGIYTEERIAGLSNERKRRWFRKGSGDNAGKVRVGAEVQSLITFKVLNLMQGWPMHGPFDIIFCRNVVIYFDKDTQRVLIDRYANLLTDDGYLFLGHSEALHDVSTRFDLLGKSSYQKVA